jgi:hypothetical protein
MGTDRKSRERREGPDRRVASVPVAVERRRVMRRDSDLEADIRRMLALVRKAKAARRRRPAPAEKRRPVRRSSRRTGRR